MRTTSKRLETLVLSGFAAPPEIETLARSLQRVPGVAVARPRSSKNRQFSLVVTATVGSLLQVRSSLDVACRNWTGHSALISARQKGRSGDFRQLTVSDLAEAEKTRCRTLEDEARVANCCIMT